ncbi:MAG: TerB N-terminal domain-containing protein [Clostridia bacterium]|nr:TerB N-terminal domain-containing protein [Clostridia bacterium]
MIFKNEDEKKLRRSKIEELDMFWDIGEITPPTKKQFDTKVEKEPEAILVVDGKGDGYVPMSEPIKRQSEEPKKLSEYSPENSFIDSVTIYSWPTRYTFYERFRVDAEKYYNIKREETSPVKYFSYMPSYIQMSLRQREWYFYWRDCVRNGKYIPTDSSYILLYIYEIINLPHIIPAEKGLELICDIWENYRKSYTKLDKFLAEWVCDYCLINELEVPLDRIASFYTEAVEAAAFKQFYYCEKEEDRFALLLMESLSSYKWRKSKYIDEKNYKVFHEHIRGGIFYAVRELAKSDGRFDLNNGRFIKKNVVRDSFSGAVCSYHSKRKISVDYFEAENVKDLSFIITDMVRYCENRVRAYLGIRARLSVQNLTEEQKIILNEYYDKSLPSVYYERKAREKVEIITEEERKPFEVSFEKAKAIEEESWQLTDRLVEYEEYEEDVVENKDNNKADASLESEALDIAKEALLCIYKGDNKGFLKIAEESYMLPETLAEVVNELCFEVLGDIGIEEKDGEYVLIPDYEEEIRQWLSR